MISAIQRWRGTCGQRADEAVVNLGVLTDGKTAAEAVASNAKRTQAMIDAVSSEPNHGVTTLGLSVNPILSYDPGTNVGTIVGFRATNGVEIKTKVGYAGQIYDAGIAAGANQSSGITFRIQNEAPPPRGGAAARGRGRPRRGQRRGQDRQGRA
jgi:uncharacterized protein